MKAENFVRPHTDTLEISGGQTITVRRRLNAGQQRALQSRMFPRAEDGTRRVDAVAVGPARVLAYLIDWTVTGLDGDVTPILDEPAEVVSDILDALEPDVFGEIEDAIAAHIKRQEQLRAEEKKSVPAGETTSEATSRSPLRAAGALSGSARST